MNRNPKSPKKKIQVNILIRMVLSLMITGISHDFTYSADNKAIHLKWSHIQRGIIN